MTEILAQNRALSADNSWKSHYIATILLSVPLVGAQLAQLGINVTDVFIIGRLGTAELAAMVLASQYFFTLFIFGSGFSTAVVPLAAHAFAQGDRMMVRRSVRMGLWVVARIRMSPNSPPTTCRWSVGACCRLWPSWCSGRS